MEIKVLGGGCPKCKVLYNNVHSALRELEMKATVVKVEDFEEISKFNVMSTPALVINDIIVAYGKIKYSQVRELIKNG
mgnify:CR=1 FL=1|jgi:small redox-active disulfide protein 2